MTPARETKRAARNHAFTLPYLAAKSQPIFLAVSRDCKKWLDGVAAIRIEDSMTNLFSFGQYLESGSKPSTSTADFTSRKMPSGNSSNALLRESFPRNTRHQR
jgi:hypothetical protein